MTTIHPLLPERPGMTTVLVVTPHPDFTATAELRQITADLDTLQAIVGGPIESLTPATDLGLWTGWHAYCNEEGSYTPGAHPNRPGQAMLRGLGWAGEAVGGCVLGPIVFLGDAGDQDEGEGDVPRAVITVANLMGLVIA